MAQPSWKTEAKPFTTGDLTAIRLTYYGEGNSYFTLDNFHIENLAIGASVNRPHGNIKGSIENARITSDHIHYQFLFPGSQKYSWNAQLLNVNGKIYYQGTPERSKGNGRYRIKRTSMPKGVYILNHFTNDGMYSFKKLLINH